MPHTLEVLPTEDLDSIAIMVKLDLRMLNIAKQREPQVVKFRAAMNKESGAIEMLRDGNSLPTAWCFLEPAQEFEVRI